jgi:hypothetical protein
LAILLDRDAGPLVFSGQLLDLLGRLGLLDAALGLNEPAQQPEQEKGREEAVPVSDWVSSFVHGLPPRALPEESIPVRAVNFDVARRTVRDSRIVDVVKSGGGNPKAHPFHLQPQRLRVEFQAEHLDDVAGQEFGVSYKYASLKECAGFLLSAWTLSGSSSSDG